MTNDDGTESPAIVTCVEPVCLTVFGVSRSHQLRDVELKQKKPTNGNKGNGGKKGKGGAK